jgi:hypothetical protein
VSAGWAGRLRSTNLDACRHAFRGCPRGRRTHPHRLGPLQRHYADTSRESRACQRPASEKPPAARLRASRGLRGHLPSPSPHTHNERMHTPRVGAAARFRRSSLLPHPPREPGYTAATAALAKRGSRVRHKTLPRCGGLAPSLLPAVGAVKGRRSRRRTERSGVVLSSSTQPQKAHSRLSPTHARFVEKVGRVRGSLRTRTFGVLCRSHAPHGGLIRAEHPPQLRPTCRRKEDIDGLAGMGWGRHGDSRRSRAALPVKEGRKGESTCLEDARDRGLIVSSCRRLRAMLRAMRSHSALLPLVGVGFWVGKQVRDSLDGGLTVCSARSPDDRSSGGDCAVLPLTALHWCWWTMVVGQMVKKKERRLDKMLAATLVGNIDFDTAVCILPQPHDSWVHFPEAETLKWFSDLVDKLWYHIDAATHKV